MPASLVCSIEADIGRGGVEPWATGWLAGPRTVVTAGHVIWHPDRPNAPFANFKVLPGRDGAKAIGEQTSRRFHLHPRWNATEGFPRQFDIGAIRLDKPFPGLSHFGILAATPQTLTGRLANIIGYPAKLKDGTKLGKVQPWFHAEAIQKIAGGQIHYQIDTSEGQSGAPLILWPDPSGLPAVGPTVVGVHTYGFLEGEPQQNKATHISGEILELLKGWIDADNS